MAKPAAVILAGGRGERLGGRLKSEITLGGIRLIDRVAASLAGCAPLIVAVGHHDASGLTLPAGAVPVTDLTPGVNGPIAGFAAAVRWLIDTGERPQWVVSVAVDTPFFPSDFVVRATGLMSSDSDVVVARYDGQAYPTNALWRLEAVRGLPQGLLDATAPHSLKRLIATLRSTPLDWPQTADGDPFANINTAEDLAAAEQRASLG
jgi:molybdenum cofactor guanylyltransferase